MPTVAKSPLSADVLSQLAHTWALSGNAQRAEATYGRAISLRPDCARAHLGLAQLYAQHERYADARAQLVRFAKISPGDASLLQVVDAVEQSQHPPAVSAGAIDWPREQLACDVMIYADSGGRTSGVAHANVALVDGLVRGGFDVVCVQPVGSTPLHAGALHLPIAWQNVYDRDQTDTGVQATAEPERIFASVNPRLIVFADGSPMSNLAAKRVARRLHIPAMFVVHCVNPRWAIDYASLLTEVAAGYRAAQVVVTVSLRSRALLESAFALPPGKGQVIYNGRPPDYFEPRDAAVRQRVRDEFEVASDALLCLTVARMELDKGYSHLVDSMRLLRPLPQWERFVFVWVGTGTSGLGLRISAEQHGLARQIRFAGTRSDVPELLDGADCLILPSHYEGMPLAVLEAMAKGVPVIATAVSGMPEALGDCGSLLPDPAQDDAAVVDQLTAQLLAWLDNPAARQAAGRCGAARARQLFTQERMVAEYRALIHKTLQSTG